VYRVCERVFGTGPLRSIAGYTLVAGVGDWQAGEGVAGDDADEVAWLTRAEIVDRGRPTAPALVPLIDLALARRGNAGA
jgi:hypothetical protein